MLVDETARDMKILNAIAAIEKRQLNKIFYPYRPHIIHLTTRFGLLFYNDKIVIPETMRTAIIAMLHQGHPSATKMDQSAETFWWPGMYHEIREKAEKADNIETDASESQVTPQAEEIEPGEEQAFVIEEPQTTEETAHEVNTPLPTTLVHCSTSHGLHPVQHDREQSTTPIRATVTTEGPPEQETVGREKGKTELKNPNEKRNSVKCEQ